MSAQLAIAFPPAEASPYARRVRIAAMIATVRREAVERARALVELAASGRVLTRWEEMAVEPYLAALALAAEDPELTASVEDAEKVRRP